MAMQTTSRKNMLPAEKFTMTNTFSWQLSVKAVITRQNSRESIKYGRQANVITTSIAFD